MDFVIVSKLPAMKAFINSKVTQCSETILNSILSFNCIYSWISRNLYRYVLVNLIMLPVLRSHVVITE